MARDLDEVGRDFRERPLDAGAYTFLAADALTMKVREGGRVIKIAVARGLNGVALITSDAHTGLVEAIGANLPGASWQRCRTPYTVNLMSIRPKHAWAGSRRC